MNFIFVSLQRINTDRDSTSTSLAKELSRNHKVLYVNAPIDRKTYVAGTTDKFVTAHIKSLKNKEGKLTQLNPNLWALNPSRIIESINWIPSTFIFSRLNWINNYRLAKDIKEALKVIRFSDFIIINDKDIFRSFYLKEILKPKLYVYLDRDYTIGMDYWKRHGVSLEPELMKKSDAVVCNSYDFTKRALNYNKDSYYIGNGFNTSQYNDAELRPVPEDLKIIPRPIIGFVGALITIRLDLQLMIDMAKAKPNWSFVIIGWQDERFAKSELHHLNNVCYLGRKHTDEVPAYLQNFDVCINPQVLNEITIGNFPLKIVEYLALGKPVVATATNTMKEVFSNHTYLATDKTSFLSQIEKALAEDNESMQQERIRFAKNFSWENVAGKLLECIKAVEGKKEG